MGKHRVLLEILCDTSLDNDGGGFPSILLKGSVPGGADAEETQGVTELSLRTDSATIRRGGEQEPAQFEHGEWCRAGPVQLRLSVDAIDDEEASLPVNSTWLDPEIDLETVAEERVHRIRCKVSSEEGTQLVVGRSGSKVDLIVDDEYVSGRHLRLFVQGGQMMVEDLGSRWGTKLNDQALGTSAVAMRDGDVLRFGVSRIRYICYRERMSTPRPG